jgi:cholinesterase
MSYAYKEDPIASGFIPMSGTAGVGRPSNAAPGTVDSAVTNWSSFSEKLGCGAVTATDVTKTLSCLRSKSASAVLDAAAPASSGQAVGVWGPKGDGKAIPIGIAERGEKGEFARMVSSHASLLRAIANTEHQPILVGNTNNEGASRKEKAGSAAAKASNCPSDAAARLRTKVGVPAWRYLYAGEFPNHTLGPCCPDADGAWHGGELALLFGTTETRKVSKGADTANEKKLAKSLRDAWAGFAKDPVHGLEKLGWPKYGPDTESKLFLVICFLKRNLTWVEEPSVIVLGGKDSAEIKYEPTSKVDNACSRPKMLMM